MLRYTQNWLLFCMCNGVCVIYSPVPVSKKALSLTKTDIWKHGMKRSLRFPLPNQIPFSNLGPPSNSGP